MSPKRAAARSEPGHRACRPAPGATEPTPPASVAGPVEPCYRDELVELYNADSADLSFLPETSVQLVVSSPPYNLGKDYGAARDDATYRSYLDWVRIWGRELYRVLEPGGRLCLNIPIDINVSFDDGAEISVGIQGPHDNVGRCASVRHEGVRKRGTRKQPVLADFTQIFVHELGFVYNTTILWLEGNISRRTAWGSWLSASDPWVNTAAEAILVLSRDRRKRSGRGRTSDVERDEFMDWTLGIWKFNGQHGHRHSHPAPFPEELPRRLIRLFSFRDDVVLDPFVGSGTTCRVAKSLGRRSIGVDINPAYCAVAAERCRRHPAP